MLRGIQFWGWNILLLITFIFFANIGHAKSNDSVSPGSGINQDDIGADITKKYLTKTIKVRVIRLCNDDGSDPGGPSYYYVNKGIEEANKVLYDNSGAKLLYTLDPETDLSECIQDTLANYDCQLNLDYFPGKGQMDITAADLENLTEADLNQDGKYNKYDVAELCDTSFQGVRRKNIAYDHVGSMVVFVRGLQARRRVKFDAELGHWVFVYPSGGYSSCAGNLIVMNSGYWGNLLAHEAGHYLCTPHTFSRNPMDTQQAKDQILAVIDKFNLDPTDSAKVLQYTFDGDWGKIELLGDHQILDTPPDPNSNIWKSVFDTDLCAAENDTISINVPEHNTDYDLQPHRFLIMSYFKGCTGLTQRFSPDQVDRIELSLDHHRQHLVKKSVVECYYSKYNGTDWTGMDVEAAFNKKDYYLGQCQSEPDLEALSRLTDKVFYPKPMPIPTWSDPIKRIFLEDMENTEIQEEIDLDVALQKRNQAALTPGQNPAEQRTWLANIFQGGNSH